MKNVKYVKDIKLAKCLICKVCERCEKYEERPLKPWESCTFSLGGVVGRKNSKTHLPPLNYVRIILTVCLFHL